MRSSGLSPDLAPQQAIDLYLTLGDMLRQGVADTDAASLSWAYAKPLLDLLDAWRELEKREAHRSRLALARAQWRLTPDRPGSS